MPTNQEILRTEYNYPLDEIRKARMVASFYKYGPVKENYDHGLIEAIPSLKKRLAMYEETGNTEFLADIMNFAMIEFGHSQHPKAHFAVLDDGKSHIVGQGVNQFMPSPDQIRRVHGDG